MAAPVDLWRQVADKWTDVYEQVGDDQWDAPTPCAAWTVRELVDHVLAWQAQGASMLGADARPGDDWPTVGSAMEATLSDPSALPAAVEGFGGIPGEDLAAFLIGDLLIHSWDLARAIDVDDTLPPEVVAVTMAGLQHVPTELLRGRNPLGVEMMGDPVEVPAAAPAQDQMVAFTGRRP